MLKNTGGLVHQKITVNYTDISIKKKIWSYSSKIV